MVGAATIFPFGGRLLLKARIRWVAKKFSLRLAEIASVFVRFDHIARRKDFREAGLLQGLLLGSVLVRVVSMPKRKVICGTVSLFAIHLIGLVVRTGSQHRTYREPKNKSDQLSHSENYSPQ